MAKDKPTHMVTGRQFTTWCGADVSRVRWSRLWANVTCKKCLKMWEQMP